MECVVDDRFVQLIDTRSIKRGPVTIEVTGDSQAGACLAARILADTLNTFRDMRDRIYLAAQGGVWTQMTNDMGRGCCNCEHGYGHVAALTGDVRMECWRYPTRTDVGAWYICGEYRPERLAEPERPDEPDEPSPTLDEITRFTARFTDFSTWPRGGLIGQAVAAFEHIGWTVTPPTTQPVGDKSATGTPAL